MWGVGLVFPFYLAGKWGEGISFSLLPGRKMWVWGVGLVFPFYLAGKWGEGISFSLLPGRKVGGGD